MRLRQLAAGLLLGWSLAAGAADFTLKDTQGQVHRLSDYRGKWVLVNFWALWCPPCLEEIPELVALHEAHKNKDLVVIGVAMDYTSSRSVTDFAAKRAISYPIVLGDHRMAQQIGEGDVEVLPTSYLYDPSGKLVSYQPGAITRDSVEAYLRSKQKR